MNTFKSRFFGIITMLGMLMFTACGSGQLTNNDIPDNSSESLVISNDIQNSDLKFKDGDTSENIISDSKQYSKNDAVNLVKEMYNVTLPVTTADDALETVKVDIPEYIEGHCFNLNLLIDEKNVLVSLFDRVGASGVDCGTGIYNLETKEYNALPDLPYEGYCAWNKNYIIFKEYNGDFTSAVDDTSVKLYLYDLNERNRKLIYTYSFDRGYEAFGHWINNIVLTDDKIYFDDIINSDSSSEQRAYLFSYDILTGEIEKTEDDAQNPMAYNDTIFYLKSNNGRYEIDTLNGEHLLELKDNVRTLVVSGNGLFSLNGLSDDIKRETIWEIKNMLTDECILKTDRTISNLIGSDLFVTFTDYLKDYPPIVYNVRDNNFIVFDEFIGMDAIWCFYSDIGLIGVRSEADLSYDYYTFKIKDNAAAEEVSEKFKLTGTPLDSGSLKKFSYETLYESTKAELTANEPLMNVLIELDNPEISEKLYRGTALTKAFVNKNLSERENLEYPARIETESGTFYEKGVTYDSFYSAICDVFTESSVRQMLDNMPFFINYNNELHQQSIGISRDTTIVHTEYEIVKNDDTEVEFDTVNYCVELDSGIKEYDESKRDEYIIKRLPNRFIKADDGFRAIEIAGFYGDISYR